MNRRDALVATLLATSLAAWLLPFARLGIDEHHDGIMLKPALDVLSGQVLFRDTFTQYGALSTYLQVAALWVQPTLLSLRLLTVAAYAVTLFFLYAAWRLILPRSLTIVACGLFILFLPAYEKNWLGLPWILLPWSSVYALLFQSAGLYALFKVIRGEQAERWGLVLGLTAACVFWCRQPAGLLHAGCVAIVWLALQWTRWAPAGLAKRPTLIAICGGFFGVHALVLGGIWLTGALPEWWYQNFIWPQKFADETVYLLWKKSAVLFLHPGAAVGLGLLLLALVAPLLAQRRWNRIPSWLVLAYYACLGLGLLWQHGHVLPLVALREGGWTILLPLVVIAQASRSLWLGWTNRTMAKGPEYYLVAALAALSLGSALQYYPVPDPWHIVWALAPAFGLVVFALWRWSGWPASVMALAWAAAFLPSVYGKFLSARTALAQPYVTLTHPAVLRGMQVLPAEAQSLGQTMAIVDLVLKHRPDIPSVLFGYDALILCFTNNRANAQPYYVAWAGLADEAAERKRWSDIPRSRPLVFWHKAEWSAVGDFYRQARYVPLLYLEAKSLEIAVPQELADAMGVGVYMAPPKPAGEKPAVPPQP